MSSSLLLLTVVGARPQFIKAATVSRAIERYNAATEGVRVDETILHTGQHYDPVMSEVFFEELGLPRPSVNLGVGAGRHGEQTAAMLAGIEVELLERQPDRVLIYGDTNSTLAGALAAAKLGIPVAHVEAGLRSADRSAPEQVNRVVADAVCDLLLCPTRTAVDNLAAEGVREGVHRVGDVMFDSLRHYADRADEPSSTVAELDLRSDEYYLATIHRAENTDDPVRLASLLAGLGRLERPVVMPLHPRTAKALASGSIAVPEPVRTIQPVSYLEMLRLIRHARIVLTDSGGLQKEAYWLGVPCVTLRDETEWVELVEAGCNRLAGAGADSVVEAAAAWEASQARLPEGAPGDLFGDGDAAGEIVRVLTG